MVISLKKMLFFYTILFLGITLIFCLYYKRNEIDAEFSSYNEEIVFFEHDGKTKGIYVEAYQPIEDVFLYYTLKQNALPLGSETYADTSLRLNSYQIMNDTLILFLNANQQNNKLFKLIYESYLTQGFLNLRLIGETFDLLYSNDTIFNLNTSLYQIIDLNGKARRIYSLNNGFIEINYLVIDDLNIISYIEKINNVSLNVVGNEVILEPLDDDFNYLYNLIKLNLNDSLFSLNES